MWKFKRTLERPTQTSRPQEDRPDRDATMPRRRRREDLAQGDEGIDDPVPRD
jgi:hypothetical protein